MVPMSVRENHGFDTAEINTQSTAIVFDRKFHRTSIEKNGVALSTVERSDDERQAMIGATLALAG